MWGPLFPPNVSHISHHPACGGLSPSSFVPGPALSWTHMGHVTAGQVLGMAERRNAGGSDYSNAFHPLRLCVSVLSVHLQGSAASTTRAKISIDLIHYQTCSRIYRQLAKMSFLLKTSLRPGGRKLILIPSQYSVTTTTLKTNQRRPASSLVTFDWEDPLSSKTLFTPEEQDIQESARAYCQERLLPRVLGTCGYVSCSN